MRNISKTMLLLFLLIFNNSCKKGAKEEPIDQQPPETLNYQTKTVQVNLPEGSDLNLNGAEVLSIGKAFPVGTNGEAKAVDIENYANLAYVFDKNENLMMAGFLSETNKEISTATTAKVLLYYAYGLPLTADTAAGVFFKRVDELAGTASWVQEFNEIWKNDPNTLTTGSYLTALKTKMQGIAGKKGVVGTKNYQGGKGKLSEAVTSETKVSDLLVDANDPRSGMQPMEDGSGQLAITNYFRRRGHAFVYKMSYKDRTDLHHNILSEIGSSTDADYDFIVDPISPINSVIGEIGKWYEEKAQESFALKSGPIALDLKENENEATYKLRVIGPGTASSSALTAKEKSKLTRLQIETFALDVFLPMVMTCSGMKGVIKDEPGYEIGKAPEKLLNAVELFLTAAPDVYDEVKKGNYKGAGYKAFDHVRSAFAQDYVKILMDICLQVGQEQLKAKGKAVPSLEDMGKSMGKFMKILTVFDATLQVGDLIAISDNIAASKELEEWPVIARAATVTLLPGNTELLPNVALKIKAEIKNMDETGDVHPYFQWSTSGNYGEIADTKGNTGKAFDTADPEVTYKSTVEADKLSDGDNIEYVYVKVYMGSKYIGTDTAKINLKKQNWFFVPFTRNDGVREIKDELIGKIIYAYGPPAFIATFPEVPGANRYQFRLLKKDGSKGNWSNAQVTKSGGMLEFRFGLGSIRLGYDVGAEIAEKERTRNNETLDKAGHQGVDILPVM